MEIIIERITPEECNTSKSLLTINYSFADSPFGEIIIASTDKGICFLEFVNNKLDSLDRLKNIFPYADISNKHDGIQENALSFFNGNSTPEDNLILHVRGTEFQTRVWNTLLHIPYGNTSTYSKIAAEINNPGAVRAVGTAIGNNPVAYIIPCHRVINSSGDLGNYRWGKELKSNILKWESLHMDVNSSYC